MTLNLNQNVLQKRVFKQQILDLHIKEFMIGQTTPYLNPDKNTLDIGAATGMYASHFAKHSRNVYCFEAVPPVFNQLSKLKDTYKNLHTFNQAVSDKIGTADFYVDDKRLSNSGFQNLVDGQKITVQTTTVDNFVQNKEIDSIGFIKIDVEGNELDVLNGAVETIEEYKPTCMVEVYEKFNKYPVATTFDYFFSRGYKCFYNHRAQGLKLVKNLIEAMEAVKIPEITDGDFLFTL